MNQFHDPIPHIVDAAAARLRHQPHTTLDGSLSNSCLQPQYLRRLAELLSDERIRAVEGEVPGEFLWREMRERSLETFVDAMSFFSSNTRFAVLMPEASDSDWQVSVFTELSDFEVNEIEATIESLFRELGSDQRRVTLSGLAEDIYLGANPFEKGTKLFIAPGRSGQQDICLTIAIRDPETEDFDEATSAMLYSGTLVFAEHVNAVINQINRINSLTDDRGLSWY